MKEQPYRVSIKDALFNWCLILVLGIAGLQWSLPEVEMEDPFVLVFVLFCAFMLNAAFSLIILLLMIGILNRKGLSFSRYVIWLNIIEMILGGGCWIIIVGMLFGLEPEFTGGLVGSIILLQLIIWNIFFYLNRRKLQNQNHD
jgi:hypothetical protein